MLTQHIIVQFTAFVVFKLVFVDCILVDIIP